jgi:hypothetical protein
MNKRVGQKSCRSSSPVQRSQERESQSWTVAETNHFPGCRRSEKGQRTEGPRASDIRTGESS